MKQRVLKRAGSTVATFLRNQCGDATLDVLSVAPEVGGVKEVCGCKSLKYARKISSQVIEYARDIFLVETRVRLQV